MLTKVNFKIDQGDQWRWSYTWVGHSVAGATATLMVLSSLKTIKPSTPWEIDHDIVPLLSLTNGAGITLGNTGLITIEFTSAQTDALVTTSNPLAPRLGARYVLVVTPLGGVPTVVLDGLIALTPNVTFSRQDGFTVQGAQRTSDDGGDIDGESSSRVLLGATSWLGEPGSKLMHPIVQVGLGEPVEAEGFRLAQGTSTLSGLVAVRLSQDGVQHADDSIVSVWTFNATFDVVGKACRLVGIPAIDNVNHDGDVTGWSVDIAASGVTGPHEEPSAKFFVSTHTVEPAPGNLTWIASVETVEIPLPGWLV